MQKDGVAAVNKLQNWWIPVGRESSITHSQWTQSCASPSKFVLTVNEHQWTWLCSQNSLQRDKSGRCEDPYPTRREENPHRMSNKYINSHHSAAGAWNFLKEFSFMVHHTYMCAQKHVLYIYCWSYHCSYAIPSKLLLKNHKNIFKNPQNTKTLFFPFYSSGASKWTGWLTQKVFLSLFYKSHCAYICSLLHGLQVFYTYSVLSRKK